MICLKGAFVKFNRAPGAAYGTLATGRELCVLGAILAHHLDLCPGGIWLVISFSLLFAQVMPGSAARSQVTNPLSCL